MQRHAEAELKARVFTIAMEDYEKEKWASEPWREPISKMDYENLIQAEVIIKKLDRQFRKLTKFHTRYYCQEEGSIWIQSTTRGGRGGCWRGPTSGGTAPTLSSAAT